MKNRIVRRLSTRKLADAATHMKHPNRFSRHRAAGPRKLGLGREDDSCRVQTLTEPNDPGVRDRQPTTPTLFQPHAKSLAPAFEEIAPVFLVKMRVISVSTVEEHTLTTVSAPGMMKHAYGPRFAHRTRKADADSVFQVLINQVQSADTT